MLKVFLLTHIGVVIVLWMIVYCSDYFLTLLGARLYRQYLDTYMPVEGSYEVTPAFQKDVDALRLLSRAFILRLALSAVLLYGVWWLDIRLDYWLDDRLAIITAAIGGLFLLEAAVHLRHMRIIGMALMARRPGGFSGRLEQSRWMSLGLSAVELAGFALLYGFISFVFGSWAFFGGCIYCLITAVHHAWLGRKQVIVRTPAA